MRKMSYTTTISEYVISGEIGSDYHSELGFNKFPLQVVIEDGNLEDMLNILERYANHGHPYEDFAASWKRVFRKEQTDWQIDCVYVSYCQVAITFKNQRLGELRLRKSLSKEKGVEALSLDYGEIAIDLLPDDPQIVKFRIDVPLPDRSGCSTTFVEIRRGKVKVIEITLNGYRIIDFLDSAEENYHGECDELVEITEYSW